MVTWGEKMWMRRNRSLEKGGDNVTWGEKENTKVSQWKSNQFEAFGLFICSFFLPIDHAHKRR